MDAPVRGARARDRSGAGGGGDRAESWPWDAVWRGTSRLTRRRRVEAERLLVIGDAAGYVEPFTGEGIAWAMRSGEAVAEHALGHAERTWTVAHQALVGVRQRECRMIARLLRHSELSSVAIAALGALPGLAGPIVRRVCEPSGAAVPREVATT